MRFWWECQRWEAACTDQHHTQPCGKWKCLFDLLEFVSEDKRDMRTTNVFCGQATLDSFNFRAQTSPHLMLPDGRMSRTVFFMRAVALWNQHLSVRLGMPRGRRAFTQARCNNLADFPLRQGPAIGSPVPARSHTAGKNCGMSFRLLGSRSTGGIASTTAPCSIRDRDNSSAGAILSPPPRTGNVNHEPTDEGRPGTPEVGEFSGLVDGAVENSAGRRANAAAGGNGPSAGRRDSSGLVVSTAASGQNAADWSLQSCDDADDGAVSKPSLYPCVGFRRWHGDRSRDMHQFQTKL